MTETYIGNQVAKKSVKANAQRHYAFEIARASAAIGTPSKIGKHGVTHNSFIAARHDDNFNVFERDWIAPLEEIT